MSAKQYRNVPTKEPDFTGHSDAWKITLEEEAGVAVAHWLVHARNSHPFWDWYMIAAIHLREVEGAPPAHLHYPGATHEILFAALDPQVALGDVDAWKRAAFLTPLDLEHQVILKSDDEMVELTELIVKHIVSGMSPDCDHAHYWSGVINKTAEHLRLGSHPVNGGH